MVFISVVSSVAFPRWEGNGVSMGLAQPPEVKVEKSLVDWHEITLLANVLNPETIRQRRPIALLCLLLKLSNMRF